MVVNWAEDLAAARGVVRWDPEVGAPALARAAASLGRRCVLLDGANVEDKDGFLRLCAHAFALPDWFGHNWDALEECLADLSDDNGIVVLWTDWAGFAEAEPDEYATAVDVFMDTARTLGIDGTPFTVVQVGDGPEDVVIDLDLDEDAEEDVDLEDDDESLYADIDARDEREAF